MIKLLLLSLLLLSPGKQSYLEVYNENYLIGTIDEFTLVSNTKTLIIFSDQVNLILYFSSEDEDYVTYKTSSGIKYRVYDSVITTGETVTFIEPEFDNYNSYLLYK